MTVSIETAAKMQASATSSRRLLDIFIVALFGAGIIFFAGYAQSAALHDAAHDVRHATGFPCH